jgi:hypothetical protein
MALSFQLIRLQSSAKLLFRPFVSEEPSVLTCKCRFAKDVLFPAAKSSPMVSSDRMKMARPFQVFGAFRIGFSRHNAVARWSTLSASLTFAQTFTLTGELRMFSPFICGS